MNSSQENVRLSLDPPWLAGSSCLIARVCAVATDLMVKEGDDESQYVDSLTRSNLHVWTSVPAKESPQAIRSIARKRVASSLLFQ